MGQSWEPFGPTRRQAERASTARPRRAPTPAATRPLPRRPAKRLVIVTCMDARVDPLAALGLSLGDANVIRNAGAMISDDVLRSLHLSHATLGTRRALLIGHTDCAGHESDTAAEASLLDGLRRIRGSGAVPEGFGLEALMYDVRTGALATLR